MYLIKLKRNVFGFILFISALILLILIVDIENFYFYMYDFNLYKS